MPPSEDIVRIEGGLTGITLWFSGPRQAGDFILYWCLADHPLRNRPLKALEPLGQYVATRPDDMLAVQEWHMASEGLDTLSMCPKCSKNNLHVLSTGAKHQRFGNQQRAVRYFCSQCQSIHEQVAVAPLPPCPLPVEVLESLRKIPDGSLPFLSTPGPGNCRTDGT